MVTYALTHSKSFAMGIGGGNVTDWTLLRQRSTPSATC